MYKTWYKKAVYVETFATSPIFSVNYEYLPFRWRRSFLSSRIGVGFIPGSTDQGISIPLSVTYNFLPGNLKGKIFKRVYTRCNPQPPKVEGETFVEAGAGYTFVTYVGKETRNFYFGIIGLRTQVIFNIPPKPRVLFLRVMFTPSYNNEGSFEPRGGLSIGVSM
jgi:hypothetical protein